MAPGKQGPADLGFTDPLAGTHQDCYVIFEIVLGFPGFLSNYSVEFRLKIEANFEKVN